MREVTAVAQVVPQQLVTRHELCQVDRRVRLRAAVGLDVDRLRAKQRERALPRQPLHDVDVRAAPVVPSAGQALRVLVRQRRADRLARGVTQPGASVASEDHADAAATNPAGLGFGGDFDLTLTARGPGGHSSLPDGPSPIDRLAAALDRVARYTFPVRLTPVAQEYLRRRAPLAGGETGAAMAALARDPRDAAAAGIVARTPAGNAILRTTCINTLLRGGTAPNAIPSQAEANVNCRIIPGEPADSIVAALRRLAAPFDVEVSVRSPATPSPPSILPAVLQRALEETVREQVGPDVPLIPYMEMGATDGLYLRNIGVPVFGVIGLFVPEALIGTAHATDERVPIAAYDGLVDFTRRLIDRLAR